MTDRTTRKRPRDINQLAARIVDAATDDEAKLDTPDTERGKPPEHPQKRDEEAKDRPGQ